MNPDDISYTWANPSGGIPAPSARGIVNPTGNYMQNAMSSTAPNGIGAGIAPTGGIASPSGFGFNVPTAQLALGGLQTIGSLWNAFQAQKLAKEQFTFQKDVTNTNLNNSIKSYNTQLEDRIRARTFTEGGTQASADAYIEKNKVTR